MIKSKFLRLHLPVSLSDLTGKLRDDAFTHSSISGFDLIAIDKISVHARYIQKIPFENIITDPFGKETVYKGFKFNIVEFEIYQVEGDIYALKLISPPRSIKSFINEIYNLCGFGVTLSDVDVDIAEFISILKDKVSPHQIKINKIKVSGLRMGAQSTANMELTSSNDALEDFLSSYEITSVNVKKAKIQIQQTEMSGVIEVSQSCMIICDESVEDLVSNLIFIFIRDQK